MRKLIWIISFFAVSLIISGCDGSGGSDSAKDTFAQNIQGKWYRVGTMKGCETRGPSKAILEITEDTMIVHEKFYIHAGVCNDSDLMNSIDRVYTYTIGAKTHDVNGKEGYEINIVSSDNKHFYTMYRLENNHLYYAQKNGNNNGLTPDKRENKFSDLKFYVKLTN